MIDWKGASILDQSYTADMKEVGRRVKNGSIGDLGASLKLSVLHDSQSRFRNQQFPLLIQALEEQEKSVRSYQHEAESARQSHAVAELTVSNLRKRIEFLEKALDQLIGISRASSSGHGYFIVPDRDQFDDEFYPELAQYLEEKNV